MITYDNQVIETQPRLFCVKNIENDKIISFEDDKETDFEYFRNKKDAKKFRDLIGNNKYKIDIGPDHFRS